MDWASSEWKQSLSPQAVQKVNALEEKVQKLLKESSQKQIRLDWLTVELEKEQRKVEKKNQDVLASQKELQSLENVCKDLESKQQKLMAEIQNRDSRIGSLEGLLSKAKQDNCKLQQLQKSLTDIKSIEDAMEKSKKEKSLSTNIGKSRPSDLISFDDSFGYCENVTSGKENDKNLLNESLSQSKGIDEKLQDKIASQDAIIKELRSKLDSLSCIEDTKEEMNVSVFATPAKAKKDVSVLSERGNFSFIDSYTSTPAKSNKERVLKHQSDVTVVDSGSDKVIALENRLKQLCQELDCQRHNFEATKTAMESKFKESENLLKTDLKFQVQACASLDKELYELKNKYQQETSQSAKKLDVITLQLTKSEQAKNQYEQEIKRLETKLNDSEHLLRKKEEELQELQKLKNVADMTSQSIQAQKSELERRCNNSLKENVTLNEQVNSYKIQLDEKLNLLREKDLSLCNMKKEIESLSHACNNLQGKIKELENKLRVSEVDYANLTQKFEKLSDSESSLKCLSVKLEKEKVQLQNDLREETSKTQRLELNVQKLEKNIQALQNQLENKALELSRFSDEMKLAKEKYECSIKELQSQLSETSSENSSLKSELKKSVAAESACKDNIKRLETEVKEISVHLSAETEKFKKGQEVVAEKKQIIKSLEQEFIKKANELDMLHKNQLESDSKNKEAMKELEVKIKDTETQLSSQLNEVDRLAKEKSTLENSLTTLENNKKDVSEQLIVEKEKSNTLSLQIDELKRSNAKLSEDFSIKNEQFRKLNENLTMEYEAATQELRDKNGVLLVKQKEIEDLSETILSLEKSLSLLEIEKCGVTEKLAIETENNKNVTAESENLRRKILELEENILERVKDAQKLEEHNKNFEETMKELEVRIRDTETQLSSQLNEVDRLSKEKLTLENSLTILENNKEDVSELLLVEKEKSNTLSLQIDELKRSIVELSEDLSMKNEQIRKLNENLTMENKAVTQELKDKSDELLVKQKEIEDLFETISSLEKSSSMLKIEKLEISEKLAIETESNKNLMAESENLQRKILELEESILEKVKDTQKLEECNKNFEETIKELEVRIRDTETQLSSQLNEVERLSKEKLTLENSLTILENNKKDVSEQLLVEKEKSNTLSLQIDELKRSIVELGEDLSMKNEQISKLNENLTMKYESVVKELEIKVADLTAELSAKENELNKLLEAKINAEKSKELLEDQLAREAEMGKALTVEKDKLKQIISELEENLAVKSQEIKKHLENNENFQKLNAVVVKEFEVKVADLIAELSAKQNDFNKLLEEKLNAEKSKELLEDQLASQAETSKELTVEKDELKQIISELEQNLIVKSQEIQKHLENNENVQKLNAVEIKNLSAKCLTLEKENRALLEKNEQLACSLENLKEIIASLEEEISHKMNEINDLRKIFSSDEKNKLEIENLSVKCMALEEEIKVVSGKNEILSCSLEEQNNVVSSLNDEIAHRWEEINELKTKASLSDTYEIQIQNLQTEYIQAQEEINSLKLQLKDLGDSEVLLKDSVAALEQDKLLLSETLNQKTDEIQSITLLKEEITCQSAEICLLKEKLVTTEKDYKASLGNALLEKMSLTQQLEESSLLINNSLNKIAFLEEEKLTLTDLLKTECQKSEMLNLELAHLKESIFFIGEDLTRINILAVESELQYESQIKELMSSSLAMQSDLTILKTQLKESRLKEMHLSELLNEETNRNKKYQRVEEKSEELSKKILLLEADLSDKSHSLAEANEKISLITSQFEKKIEASKNKLALTLEEYQVMKSLLDDSLLNEDTLKEKISVLENERMHLDTNVTAEIEKNNYLKKEKKNCEEKITSLEEKLIVVSNELEETKKALLEKQGEVFELENRLESAKTELKESELQLQDSINNESVLNERLSLVNTENSKLTTRLEAQSEKIETFQTNLVEVKEKLEFLNNELIVNAVEFEECHKQLVVLTCDKDKTTDLERKVESLQTELDQTVCQLHHSTSNEHILKDNLSLMELEKTALATNLANEFEKVKTLETTLEEMTKKLKLLNEELLIKSSELEELKKQLNISNQNKEEICELSKQLSCLQSLYESTQLELTDSRNKEISLSQQLLLANEEKTDVMSRLKEQLDRVESFKITIEELNAKIKQLNEELSHKSSELCLCKEQLCSAVQEKDCLHHKLESLTLLSDSTQSQISNLIESETSLKTKVSVLEEEKLSFILHSTEDGEKISNLEQEIEALKHRIVSLEELKLEAEKIYDYQKNYFLIQKHKVIDDENIFKSLDFLAQNSREMFCSCDELCFSSNSNNILGKVESSNEAGEFTYGVPNDIKRQAFSVLEYIYSLENTVLSNFEKCKFLWAYHLLRSEDEERSTEMASSLQRIFLLLQDQKAVLNFVLGISNIKSISKHTNFTPFATESNCIPDNVFVLESGVTDNLIADILELMCVHREHIMHYTAKELHKCVQNLKQPILFMENQGNISSSNCHYEITLDIKYLLYEYKIGSCYSKMNSSSLIFQENEFYLWDSADEKQIKDTLQKLEVKGVSNVLEFYVTLNDDAISFVKSSDLKNINFETFKSFIFMLLHKYNQTESAGILEELLKWANFNEFLKHSSKCLSRLIIKRLPCSVKNTHLSCIRKAKVKNRISKSEPCLNCFALQEEKETLELAVRKEKEKQRLLNSTIEEIEQDLGNTFMQKCHLQDTIIEIGKMFEHFKNKPIDSELFSESEFSSAVFSKTCLCESCVKQDSETTHSGNTVLSAEAFALWINEAIGKCGKMESKIKELEVTSSQEPVSSNYEKTSVQMYEELQESLKQFECQRNDLEKELSNYKDQYHSLSEDLSDKNLIISQLESEKTEVTVFLDQCQEKVEAYEKQLLKLSGDKDAFKLEIASKEENIKTMQETMNKQNEMLENLRLESKTYENKIAELESEMKEKKMKESEDPDLNDEREKLITAMQEEVKALQRSNDTLNFSIERSEQEIQTITALKQSLEEEVNKLSVEKSKMNLDIATWKNMYETEKKSTCELTSKLEKLEIEKLELEEELIDFQIINDDLEQDGLSLKNLQQEYQTYKLTVSDLKNLYETEKKSTSELTSKVQQLENEKMELDEKLEQIQIVNANLERDWNFLKNLQQEHDASKLNESTWKDMYETEKKTTLELSSKVQQLDKEKIGLGEELKQLHIVIEGLEREVCTLRSLQQEYEACKLNVSTWKDKYDTKKKSISELRDKIQQLENERIELSNKLKQIQIVNEDIQTDLSSLKNLQHEHNTLKQEVSTSKDMYEKEKNYSAELSNKVQMLEKELEEKVKQFKIKNDSLERDVSTLKNLQREHEHTLLAKNHSLEEKEHTIQMLQERINEIESNKIQHDKQIEQLDELENLRSRLKETSENASLEKKVELESEKLCYQKTLEEVGNEKCELKNKINLLKQNVDELTQDLKLQKEANLELNTQLETAKTALMEETAMHKASKNTIKAKEESINSLNSSLKQNLYKITELENQMLMMKEKNDKLLESNLLSKQEIRDLSKNISHATHSLKELEEKYSELSCENSELYNALEKEKKMSVSKNNERQALDKIQKFTDIILNSIEEIVRNVSGSSSNEQLQNDLESLKKQFIHGFISSNIEDLSERFYDNLKSFFKNNLRNTEEEHKIHNLICSFSDAVNHIGQFVDSLSDTDSPKTLCFVDNTINVTFNETLLVENTIEMSSSTYMQIIKDLQQTRELLESYFSTLKTIILKQTDNYKDLKFKLDHAFSKTTSSKSQEDNENFVPKWKFKLVRVSAHRWEEEANKVKHLYANLKETVKVLEEKLKAQAEKIDLLEKEKQTLEEENKSLNEEADELAADYKNLQTASTEEYCRLSENIEDLKQKLDKTIKENKELMTALNKLQISALEIQDAEKENYPR